MVWGNLPLAPLGWEGDAAPADFVNEDPLQMALFHLDPFVDEDDYEEMLIEDFVWAGPGEGPTTGNALCYYPPLPVEVAASSLVRFFLHVFQIILFFVFICWYYFSIILFSGCGGSCCGPG